MKFFFQRATSSTPPDGSRKGSQKWESSSSSATAEASLTTPHESIYKPPVLTASSMKKSEDGNAPKSGGGGSSNNNTAVVPCNLNVLVVTSNMVNSKLAANMLERLGHDVTLVESGPAAVDRIQNNGRQHAAFDVVMMDFCMATSNVQSLGFPSNIHMIAMTGSKVPGNFLELGFRSWVQKPLKMKELQDKLLQVYHHHEAAKVTPDESSSSTSSSSSSCRPNQGGGGGGSSTNRPTTTTTTLSCLPDHSTSTMIEILPGYSVPFRGPDEIRDYVRREKMVPAMCFQCDLELFWSIHDAEYVVCPKCKVIQPLTATEEGIVCGSWKGGVGLGITNEMLYAMKDEICQENLLTK